MVNQNSNHNGSKPGPQRVINQPGVFHIANPNLYSDNTGVYNNTKLE
ncbi:MAG: hypothetical protein LBU61_06755 [Coriobacteriales bacterium]|jgi:hypothetical protein|nr:hypothetical protein [Coriobacteriales bacterium]